MERSAVLSKLQQTIWAIYPPALEAMVTAVAVAGARAIEAAAPRNPSQRGAVAVVPVVGRLSKRGPQGFIEEMLFGGTSYDRLIATVRQLVAADGVGSIVLDIDSPGGAVEGCPEAADELFKMRGTKPIIAVANTMAASAAYDLAAQADEVIVSPSSLTGSIGVIAIHEDLTKMAEGMGAKVTLLTAGKFKAVGHPLEPLTEETEALFQKQIDAYYGMFVDAVARGRGVKASEVRAGFGEGWIVGAKEAVQLGMADRVGTMRDTLMRLGGASREGASAQAVELEWAAIDAEPPAEAADDLDLRERRLRLAART